MTVSVWRIAQDARNYEADDVSGKGAEITGGRWNHKGTPLLYTSASRALACLETVVHLNAGGLPLNRYLVEIVIPAPAWRAATIVTAASARVGWDAEPAGKTSMDFGTAWVRSAESLLLIVPSVVVPEEANVLINPLHADARTLHAVSVRRWLYDPRLKADAAYARAAVSAGTRGP